jgi:hypothetical protein
LAASQDPSPGWHPDPFGRFARRFWDGDAWTAHVTDAAGVDKTDPPSHGSHVTSTATTDEAAEMLGRLDHAMTAYREFLEQAGEMGVAADDEAFARQVHVDRPGAPRIRRVDPRLPAGAVGALRRDRPRAVRRRAIAVRPGSDPADDRRLERIRAATTREEIERLLAGSP